MKNKTFRLHVIATPTRTSNNPMQIISPKNIDFLLPWNTATRWLWDWVSQLPFPGTTPWSSCPPSTSPSARWPRSARPLRSPGTSRDSAGSSGPCPSPIPTVQNSTRTSRSSGHGLWWHSTPGTSENFTGFWRAIGSPRCPTQNSRPCGWKRTTKKQRSCEAGLWVLWTSTGWGRSTRCPGPSGMESRRPIVLRRGPGVFWGSGTCRIRTRIRRRSGNWPRRRGWRRPRSGTGSRIDGRGTELRQQKIGKDLLLFLDEWFKPMNVYMGILG